MVPNFRVRTIPVMGALPASFGMAMAAFALAELAGAPLAPSPPLRFQPEQARPGAGARLTSSLSLSDSPLAPLAPLAPSPPLRFQPEQARPGVGARLTSSLPNSQLAPLGPLAEPRRGHGPGKTISLSPPLPLTFSGRWRESR